jgi:hypothetical protein
MGVLFAISRIFLPARAALVLAMLLVVAGGVGGILGLLVQLPFVGDSLVSGTEVARFFLVILASGGASAVGVLWIFLRWRRGQSRRADASTFD